MEIIEEPGLERGEFMEEQLRAYFLDMGYYVLRGAKLKFQEVEVTDIDLWIYHRSTPISRERINVDIKNKAKPAAIERIIVAKGIMDILGFDRCIVATTDKRNEVLEFGEQRNVVVLNGNFLSRIKRIKHDRFSEETFNSLIKDEFSKFTTNWYSKNEQAKSRLIQNLDFITANQFIVEIGSLLAQIHSTPTKQESLLRLLYLYLSYLCICLDYILKDFAFIETSEKFKLLDEGFKYGVFGTTKIKLRLEQLSKDTHRGLSSIKSAIENLSVNILVDFFGKVDSSKHLFGWAKEFEGIAYKKATFKPSELPVECKSIIGVMCDFTKVDRKLILGI